MTPRRLCGVLAVVWLCACDKPAPEPATPEVLPDSGDAPGGPRGPETVPGPVVDPEPKAEPKPEPAGEQCGDETCTDGRECVRYYGIAGPRGPEFRSCEWRCNEKQACPNGTTCTTIADGPGAVCR